MRIIHTADWHLGKNLEGMSRLEEQEAFLKDFVSLVEEHQADLVIIAGDVFDSGNPPSKGEALFYETLKALSRNGERLTVVIAGNHDNPARLVAAGPLAKEHGIIMVGTPKTVVDTGDYGRHQVLRSGEGFIEILVGSEKAVILTVPYPSEKRLNEVLYADAEGDPERLASYTDRLKSLFEGLASEFREDTVNLVVSHLFAMDCEEAGSERSIQLGGSYIVSADCFPPQAQYVALGHVHKPQAVPGTGKKVRYSGSPLHYSRRELSFQKQCLLIEVAPGAEAVIRELPLKVYKPIEVWRCGSIAEALAMAEANSERSCWVYLEIETDVFIREDQIKALRSFKKDILEITPVFSQRADQAAAGPALCERSFTELFREFYLKERRVDPAPELEALLMSIIEEEEA